MINNFLIHNFKDLTTTPENVEQLKKLVLQMAVQGKLTTKWRKDNPDVEPASVLLEKIKAEKEQLLKEGKIKRLKPIYPISNEEKPFGLPDNWLWIRIIDYGLTNTGTTPSKNNPEYFGKDYPFVKPAEISYNGINYETDDGLTVLGLTQARLIPKNSVLMVCIGGSIGKCNYTTMDVACNQQINTITPLASISSVFLNLLLQSEYLQDAVWDRASGGTTPIINKGKWERIPIPLPPLAEQQAIVSQVEKLFTQIDQLHALAQKRLNYREKSAKALFSKINHPENDTELQETWQTLTAHFHTLTQSKESVKQLRQSILQMAVQGKLTAKWRKENLEVEPASALLEKIKEYKRQLFQEGKIKWSKPMLPISNEEKPFGLPDNWEWSRLANYTEIIMGQSPKSESYNEIGDGLPFYQGKKEFGKVNPISVSVWCNEPSRIAFENDILISVRAPVGYVNISNQECAIGRGLAIIRPILIETLNYLFYFLNFQKDRWITKGSFFQSINSSHVNNMVMPIPPVKEQKVLVTKVNQLMSWCDELEKKIEKRDAYQAKMMQAVVKQAFKTEAEN